MAQMNQKTQVFIELSEELELHVSRLVFELLMKNLFFPNCHDRLHNRANFFLCESFLSISNA